MLDNKINEWLISNEKVVVFLASSIGIIITRVPFHSQFLSSWDSANLALGLLRYSPIDDHPHPPGYVLYIAAAHIFNFFLHNENQALVA